MPQFSDEDQGKDVTLEGEKVGVVQSVDQGTAEVNPDAGITDQIKAKLNWGEADANTYPMRTEDVERITDDEVQLKS